VKRFVRTLIVPGFEEGVVLSVVYCTSFSSKQKQKKQKQTEQEAHGPHRSPE
jgi:hypothetical protein